MVTISVLVLLLFANTVLWLPGLIAISLKLFYDPYMNIRPYMLRLPLLYAVDWMRVLVAICMWLVFFGTIAWLIHDLALVVNNSSKRLEYDEYSIVTKMASHNFKVGDRVLAPYDFINKTTPATVMFVWGSRNILVQYDNPNFGNYLPGYLSPQELELVKKYDRTGKAWAIANPHIAGVMLYKTDLLSVINSLKRDGTVPSNFKELITEYIEKRVG